MVLNSLRSIVAGLALVTILAAGPTLHAQAQARFTVLAHDTISQLGGLNVYTIRDEQLAACYALFTIDQLATISKGTGSPVSAQRAEQPASPGDTRTEVERQPPGPALWATLPATTPAPSALTGGWEYLAESMRRALVHPATVQALTDPLSDKLSDLGDRLGRIELLLKEQGAPRLTVLPVPCGPAVRK